MSFKKGNLYTNEAKTEGIYPNTVYSAIYKDDMSKTLDADLGDLSHYNAQTITSGVDPLYLHLDMDLLWTNASPTSAFAAQTVSLDLSEYSFIMITSKSYAIWANNSGVLFNTFAIVPSSICITSGAHDTSASWVRPVTINSNSAVFGAAGIINNTGGTSSQDNYMNIPLQIYGIR